jgi:hypothetical protein
MEAIMLKITNKKRLVFAQSDGSVLAASWAGAPSRPLVARREVSLLTFLREGELRPRRRPLTGRINGCISGGGPRKAGPPQASSYKQYG